MKFWHIEPHGGRSFTQRSPTWISMKRCAMVSGQKSTTCPEARHRLVRYCSSTAARLHSTSVPSSLIPAGSTAVTTPSSSTCVVHQLRDRVGWLAPIDAPLVNQPASQPTNQPTSHLFDSFVQISWNWWSCYGLPILRADPILKISTTSWEKCSTLGMKFNFKNQTYVTWITDLIATCKNRLFHCKSHWFDSNSSSLIILPCILPCRSSQIRSS